MSSLSTTAVLGNQTYLLFFLQQHHYSSSLHSYSTRHCSSFAVLTAFMTTTLTHLQLRFVLVDILAVLTAFVTTTLTHLQLRFVLVDILSVVTAFMTITLTELRFRCGF
jgi:hypothetical protein